MPTGPDVSRHQGTVDYGAVRRAGHDFAIIKATEGTSYSYLPWFHRNAPLVKGAGLVLGAYHFLRTSDPAAQARYYVAQVNAVGGFRGVIAVLDVETAADGTKPQLVHVEAFAKEFRRLVPGHLLVIYTGRWYWVGLMGNPTGAHLGPLWHSEYETTPAEVADGPESDQYGGWDGCTLWQWTSSGSCPGISGRCDLNILLRGTLADLTGGGQSAPGPVPVPDVPQTDPTLTEVDMLLVHGPGGAALVSAGYWKNIGSDEYEDWKLAGLRVVPVDQPRWDRMRASVLYGTTADDNVA